MTSIRGVLLELAWSLLLIVGGVGLLWAPAGHSLRMINLDAPQIALQGDTIHLSCLFKLSSASGSANKRHPGAVQTPDNHQHLSLTAAAAAAAAASGRSAGQSQTLRYDDQEEEVGLNELLYAIKWYKEGKEFYRYVAQDWPKKQALSVDGVHLDLNKSDNHTIVLRSVSLRTSGLYRCEVSTDAPRFITKSIERRLLVYAIPNKGPAIELAKPKHGKQVHLGESVELVCSTPESKPPLSLDWIINDTLNLSSAQNSDSHRFFNFSSSRLVRLPSLLATSAKKLPISGSDRVGQQTQEMPSQIFYLIHNGSVASPLASPATGALAGPLGEPQTINLTGSLDRLAETSTARLNFTVDANLSLYLSQLGVGQRTASSMAVGAKSRGARQALAARSELTSTANEILPPSTKFKDYPRRPAYEVAKKRATTSADASRSSALTLKVRCVARVMHLMMSDEIKLKLVFDKAPSKAETLDGLHEANSSEMTKSGDPGNNHRNMGWTTCATSLIVALIISL